MSINWAEKKNFDTTFEEKKFKSLNVEKVRKMENVKKMHVNEFVEKRIAECEQKSTELVCGWIGWFWCENLFELHKNRL